MIEQNTISINSLVQRIKEDFRDLIPNIQEDILETTKHNPYFKVWTDENGILGYMGIIEMDKVVYCSYTKAYDKRIIKRMYVELKKLKKFNKPIVTDGTNFDHCKNHVKPFRDTALFEWII